jgi:hypothetical protein
MSEIILSSGAYHKYVSGSSIAKTILKHGGYSLTTAVLDILAANTCCTKNIVADSLTINKETVTATSNTITINSAAGRVYTVPLTTAPGSDHGIQILNSYIKTDSVIQLTVYNPNQGVAVLAINVITDGSLELIIHNVGTSPFNSSIGIHFLIL